VSPYLKEKPVKNTPECNGCDECGTMDGEILYSLQHDRRWLCRECFFRTPIGGAWPKPRAEDEDVRATKKLELAEKVFAFIEKHTDDPNRIKKAIARYREKVAEEEE